MLGLYGFHPSQSFRFPCLTRIHIAVSFQAPSLAVVRLGTLEEVIRLGVGVRAGGASFCDLFPSILSLVL